jgi:hypothetical protein
MDVGTSSIFDTSWEADITTTARLKAARYTRKFGASIDALLLCDHLYHCKYWDFGRKLGVREERELLFCFSKTAVTFVSEGHRVRYLSSLYLLLSFTDASVVVPGQ